MRDNELSPQRRLFSYKQLTEMGIRFSREHLWRLEAANRFPRRVRLSPQKIAWFEHEILDWLEQRSAERAGRIYRDHA
jgi:prophage regulatory protein